MLFGELEPFHRDRIDLLAHELGHDVVALTRVWRSVGQSANPHCDEALFLLLLDSDMRIGEAVALTTDTLQLDQRRVIVGAKGKARRERAVPIGDAALPGGGRTLRALRTYLAVRPKSDAREVRGSPRRGAYTGAGSRRGTDGCHQT